MIAGLEELLVAASQLQAFLSRRGWRFCFIGGVAVQRWGNPRFTEDIDLTLLTGFGREEEFVDGLLEELQPRGPVRPNFDDYCTRSRKKYLLSEASSVYVH